MIREINIKNIRGIREGSLSGLSRVVVFVGPNNSGKSTVLDAISLCAPPNFQDNLNRTALRRPGIQNSNRWLLFRENGISSSSGQVSINGDTGQTLTVSLSTQGEAENQALLASAKVTPHLERRDKRSPPSAVAMGDVSAIRMVDPARESRLIAELFSDVARRGLKGFVYSIIADLIPDVTDIGLMLDGKHGGQPATVAYLDYKSGAKPVALAGDGVQQLFLQCLELAVPVGGTLLLEEPECHLHPRAILQSVRAILATASRGIQVILTTHSLDLIDMLLAETKTEDLDTLSFYRLKLRDGQLESSRSSGSEASFSREQIAEDLR